MKRTLATLVCLALTLCLAACGGTPAPEAADTPAPETVPAEDATPAPTANMQELRPILDGEEASGADTAELAPATAGDAAAEALDEALYEAARACIGKSAEELIAAIGEPTGGAGYAASCLQEDAEDGMLYYPGFYVWTLRTAESELVHDVYLLE